MNFKGVFTGILFKFAQALLKFLDVASLLFNSFILPSKLQFQGGYILILFNEILLELFDFAVVLCDKMCRRSAASPERLLFSFTNVAIVPCMTLIAP